MDLKTEVIPDNLRAISWMDGCHGQLKLITQEDVLKDKIKLNINSNKHSPARTGVEQAADCGPMFKKLRKNVKSMPAKRNALSPITSRLTKLLDEVSSGSSTTRTDIVIIKGAKRKAIIEGLSKLPNATGDAYNRQSIVSGFFDNGQLDKTNLVLPCLKSLIGTYRGPISKDHCLYECTDLVTKFYREMYLTGRIEESSFENAGIVHDTDSFGNKVTRDYTIGRENYQRAKVLSAQTQREERIALKKSIKEQIDITRLKSGVRENNKYEENTECERRVTILYFEINVKHESTSLSSTTSNSTTNTQQGSFQAIDLSKLTLTHFGKDLERRLLKYKPTLPQLKAFIQLRDINIPKNKRNYPVYKSLSKLSRDDLMNECIKAKSLPIQSKLFS